MRRKIEKDYSLCEKYFLFLFLVVSVSVRKREEEGIASHRRFVRGIIEERNISLDKFVVDCRIQF